MIREVTVELILNRWPNCLVRVYFSEDYLTVFGDTVYYADPDLLEKVEKHLGPPITTSDDELIFRV